MSILCTDMSVTSCLSLDEVVQVVKEREKQERTEFPIRRESDETRKKNNMMGVAKLTVEIMKRTAFALLHHQLYAFDANPGDHGCQTRAVIIHQLSQSAKLQEEAKRLQTLAQSLSKQIQNCKTYEYFETHFQSIKVSDEMAFLLQCYLMAFIRIRPEASDTESGRLTKITKNKLESKLLIQITERTGCKLSESSIQFLQGIVSTFNENTDLLPTLLADPHIRRIKSARSNFIKAFAPVFFQVLAMLEYAKKQGAIICIENEEKTEKTYFKSTSDGIKVNTEEIKTNTPMIVIRGKGSLNGEDLEKMLLHLIAKEPPYDRKTSTLEDLTHNEACDLIRKNQEEKVSSSFQARHILCDTYQGEKV